MKAIVIREPGDPSVLELANVDQPTMGRRDIVVDVHAAAVNRADVSQRRGTYPPPPGAPLWPGLEISGIVSEVGNDVTLFSVGDRVCALLAGGGYAERAVVDERHALPVPAGVDLLDAAGLIEAITTVWHNVFMLGELKRDDVLLVHGGSSGIGTMAIQLAGAFGARAVVTVGSAEKADACRSLGADLAIEYREEAFESRVVEEYGGADVILDSIGGGYLSRNLTALRTDGRIMNIGNLSGEEGTLNFGALMRKRATIRSTTLRSRSIEDKANIVASVRKSVWPLVESGEIRPVIFARFPLNEAAAAHRLLESSGHIGKLLLIVER
ncbi:NAD(P)H-quinone oxidoreductase [Cryobacterium sp. PH29-G1]|uniref:NAD(P)H-quinone oxidoreductase n=1 Tax=Cryobacterium sp. PH29-G1 TaxID=3046211 RepID=UPI0024B91BA0|nr:NAD(P)H-quinone oxidoreductase [Cryobacterium sp. PH29-G1]MDJ0350771.1 NAD(P)H-quinone oxidoreductase [Cryobacterium sp. PH29-G1]